MKEVKLDYISLGIGGLLGLGLGAAGGAYFSRRALQARTEARIEAEVAAARAHYNDRAKADMAASDQHTEAAGLGNGGDELVSDEGGPWIATGISERGEEEFGLSATSAGPIQVSAFQITSELARRIEDEVEGTGSAADGSAQPGTDGEPEGGKPTGIRVISLEEFADTPDGWEEPQTLTYYAGDGVLCDAKDDPIRTPVLIVGNFDLTKFRGGVIGVDPVYIRNAYLQSDLEVVFNAGSYVDVILGYGNPANKRTE